MCFRRANPGTMLLGLLMWPNYFYQCNGRQTRIMLDLAEFEIWAGFGSAGSSKMFCNFAKIYGCFFIFQFLFIVSSTTKKVDWHKSEKTVNFCCIFLGQNRLKTHNELWLALFNSSLKYSHCLHLVLNTQKTSHFYRRCF